MSQDDLTKHIPFMRQYPSAKVVHADVPPFFRMGDPVQPLFGCRHRGTLRLNPNHLRVQGLVGTEGAWAKQAKSIHVARNGYIATGRSRVKAA